MKSLLRRAVKRMRLVLGAEEPKKRVLPLVRDTYGALGGSSVFPNLTGVLRLSRLDPASTSHVTHECVLTAGCGYHGMDDNDIRGHLDGTFHYAWNQVSQKYVRTGRIEHLFRFGEYELFRALQRWDDLPLPQEARIEGAELRLQVQESDVEFDRTLLLYAMRRDWNPGGGGVSKNNLSPPAPGEVWWNEARHGDEAWGLPGGSCTSDRDPAPLAEATLPHGGTELTFSSGRLTRYVAGQVTQGKPLLFMIKLQDHQEDVPGSLIHIWSESEGDDKGRSRKPELALRWTMPGEPVVEEDVLLEPGRALVYPSGEANFVTFGDAQGQPFEVAARASGCGWRVVQGGHLRDTESEVRIRAVSNAVPIGSTFSARFRDTWVRTAAPRPKTWCAPLFRRPAATSRIWPGMTATIPGRSRSRPTKWGGGGTSGLISFSRGVSVSCRDLRRRGG